MIETQCLNQTAKIQKLRIIKLLVDKNFQKHVYKVYKTFKEYVNQCFLNVYKLSSSR